MMDRGLSLQDSQLNELRHMTGAIIDLHVIQGTRCSFERVDWTISHPSRDVRDFVLRRLNHWMQQTQLACDMTYDDAMFLEEQRQSLVWFRVEEFRIFCRRKTSENQAGTTTFSG